MLKLFGRALLSALLVFALSSTASATDGHFLHGVGAVNSAMAGTGVAAPSDVMGAFYLNPAGLTTFDGGRLTLGFEMFKPQRTVSSSAGAVSGSTTSKSDISPVPNFGFSRPLNERVTLGLAALGVGGFGVDYPADPTNPILAPRPYGLGQVASDFQLLKIVPALSFKATDKLHIGAAMNVDWAKLAVDPMPVAAPEMDPGPDGIFGTPDDLGFFSRATASDGAFGVGFQAGLIYEASEHLNLGLAYTSTQWFEDFEFNAINENPNSAEFGTPREIVFALDVPSVLSFGLAVKPTDRLQVNGDLKHIAYSETAGFEEEGFGATGEVLGFGWEDIWVYGVGSEYRIADGFTIRGGYQYSENPVPDDLSMFNVPAPAIVCHHVSLGLGLRALDGVTVDAGYYHAFQESITGQFQTPMGAVPGTSVTSEMSENSFLIQFTFDLPER